MELRGLHQEWTHGERRQTGLSTFRVGQGGHFSRHAGARSRSSGRSGFCPGRARRRRASTPQNQQTDQGKTTGADGHAGRPCKARAAGQGGVPGYFRVRMRTSCSRLNTLS
jgi:hypothetical protein